ncbi:MAG: 2-C-methyl-D-erythritol 2,4-cyclodiphosphate synthase [Selenomonadaceae bacterium]|nr:2-C-methyl-D-erythritol 2,4-cyclodiphosphate synthase [Selenomonadaceae bacterium]
MIRIGNGYDVHRLVEGRRLIIGGVEIDYPRGLLGHSDADVLLHAIIDAMLGAAALGDIGQHFPDNDPSIKNIDSGVMLERVNRLLAAHNFTVVNVDSIVVAQRPKLAPYIQSMRQRIADLLKIDIDRISVKAKTEEGLGFTGSGDGIAAHAAVLIEEAGR